MATKQSTVDYIVDQLASVEGISTRKMFGEYALYCGPKVVGLVCDDTLYVKITEQGKDFVGEYYEEGHAYPGAKVSMVIDGDRIEDREWLSELIRLTHEHLPLAKGTKRAQEPRRVGVDDERPVTRPAVRLTGFTLVAERKAA